MHFSYTPAKEKVDEFSSLLEFLLTPELPLYHEFFDKSAHEEKDVPSLVPHITQRDVQNIPLLKRIYTKEKYFVKKITLQDHTTLLVPRTLGDIEMQAFDFQCSRPLIMQENRDEGIELGLWFYQKNILPLLAESDIDITVMAAKKYKVDGLVCDATGLQALIASGAINALPYLQKIWVTDCTFPADTLRIAEQTCPVSLLFTLPEIGLVGTQIPNTSIFDPHFHVESYILVTEEVTNKGGTLITSLDKRAHPIVGRRINLAFEKESSAHKA